MLLLQYQTKNRFQQYDARRRQQEAIVAQVSAENTRLSNMLSEALDKYAQSNGGQLPAEVSQLKPYFRSPPDDSVFQRYQMTKTGSVNDLQRQETVVEEKGPLPTEHDKLIRIGINYFDTYTPGHNPNVTGTFH
jgi:hypothetical protein